MNFNDRKNLTYSFKDKYCYSDLPMISFCILFTVYTSLRLYISQYKYEVTDLVFDLQCHLFCGFLKSGPVVLPVYYFIKSPDHRTCVCFVNCQKGATGVPSTSYYIYVA